MILHEISHGVVALRFGDDTAKRAGRLTLNPVPHIDPLGSIILPAFGALAGVPVIAWAKPVPVNPNRLRNPRRDMLSCRSPARPRTSLLALVQRDPRALAVSRAVRHAAPSICRSVSDPVPVRGRQRLLGVFNFLPIPPLDGAALIERVLPREWLPRWYAFRQYGFLILFVLVFCVTFGDRIISAVARSPRRSFVVG